MAANMDDDDFEALFSEQRNEIMAAKITESDMDVAFNLQLQEAIAASLPSSSSHSCSPSSTPLFEEERNSTLISDVLLQEIERYEQERKDFELCRLEMSRIKLNLNIRLHDHKFASKIAQIPEDEWRVNGDNYHMPYGEAGSSSSYASSSSGNSEEYFRLYFRGIVAVDLRDVNDLKKLAAVGVAICDPEDNVIFVVSKPLMVDEGEMSEERVEVEALVEGLNVALALGLNSLVFYCHDLMLYEYVRGLCEPSEVNMINLIKNVKLLQGNFVYCKPLPAVGTDIMFAFQLARSVISSHVTKLAGSSRNDVNVTCSICFEDTNARLMFSVDGCGHQYCFFCMKHHVEVKVSQRDLPNCPYEGCEPAISVSSCEKFLAPKFLEIMSQLEKETSIPAHEKVYCPWPSCSALMHRHEVKEYSRTSVMGQDEQGASRCIECQRLFCVDCKVTWHYFMTCSDYQLFLSQVDHPDTKLKSLADTKKWRQCPKCADMIELAEGCYHMTCRCGHDFCYLCGASWENKKPTCNCVLWDEGNILSYSIRVTSSSEGHRCLATKSSRMVLTDCIYFFMDF